MTRVITGSTEDWLRDNLATCQARFSVASPFVTGFFGQLLGDFPKRVDCRLLTRTDLRDFALGTSDLEALCGLAKRGVAVKALSRLHAKVYVVDSSRALVTSANATRGGLIANIECGLEVTDAPVVGELRRLLASGFGAPEPPSAWTAEEL